MASPDKPTDLPKSANDTACFSFGCKIFVSASCFQLTLVGENPAYFRTFATDRKQVDFGQEKEVFPLVLIQMKSAAKRTVLDPKKSEKWLFYRLNVNSFVFKHFDMLHREINQLTR